MVKLTLIFVFIEILLSFYLRWNFRPFYQTLGFYQGDIWYFYTYFGHQAENLFFYPFDYPVGYLLIHKFTFWMTSNIFQNDSYEFFLLSNALLIIPILLVFIYLIYKIADSMSIRKKLILPFLIFSPSLLIYSNINYDIFPSLTVILATYLALKNKFDLSFFALAVGTAIKIYPIFLVPIFIMYMLNNTVRPSKIIRVVFIFILSLSLINLPFILYNFSYWSYPFIHQAINPEKNDPTTLSYFLFNKTGLGFFQDFFVFGLLLVSYLVGWQLLKKNLLTKQNLLTILSLTSFSLVFGNHVYTPQYILWFLPFVALTQIPNILFWLPFDFLNAATRFFYFKLKTDWSLIFHFIWDITIVFFIYLYILLITKIIKSLVYKLNRESL